MAIFNACEIIDDRIYYFKLLVGIVEGKEAKVLEQFYCRELEKSLEELNFTIVWVSSLPEVEKAG